MPESFTSAAARGTASDTYQAANQFDRRILPGVLPGGVLQLKDARARTVEPPPNGGPRRRSDWNPRMRWLAASTPRLHHYRQKALSRPQKRWSVSSRQPQQFVHRFSGAKPDRTWVVYKRQRHVTRLVPVRRFTPDHKAEPQSGDTAGFTWNMNSEPIRPDRPAKLRIAGSPPR